jgi:hypothetical protein
MRRNLVCLAVGTPSASTLKSTTAAKMTWAPSTTATDIAGNAASATPRTPSA